MDIIKSKKIEINDSDYIALSDFSYNYEKFLNVIYPGFIDQKDLLNQIATVVINNYNGVLLKTIDGSFIHWEIYKSKSVVKKLKNPFKDKLYISYRYKKIEIGNINKSKMLKFFLPGLIHSIDASIIRIIILRMYHHGYLINHVHDSIMFHPNYYEILYEELYAMYVNPDVTYNIIENSFIKPSLGIVNDDNAKKTIIKLYQKISSNFQFVNVVGCDLKIYDIYRFE